MQLLEDVQCSIESFKAMNLTNFYHTSNLVSFHLKEVLHLDLKKSRKKNLKHGYIPAKENELLEWNRHVILFMWTPIYMEFI